MEDIKTLNRRYEAVAWGALFLWLGVRELLPGLPTGTGLLGVGAIFVGLNLARRLRHLPLNGVSTTLGVTALFMGGVVLFLTSLGTRVELPFFPVLLVLIGVGFLAHSVTGVKSATSLKNEYSSTQR